MTGVEIFRSQWPGSKYRYRQGDRFELDRLLSRAAEREHVIEKICLCPSGRQSLAIGERLLTVAKAGDVSAVLRHCYGHGLGVEVAFVADAPKVVWLCVHADCRHKAEGRRR